MARFVRVALCLLLLNGAAAACRPSGRTPPDAAAPPAAMADTAVAREAMVDRQIEARGIRDPRVLAAMRQVPRERFIPPDVAPLAYADQPLPIGYGQTISQPYIVAYMSEALHVNEN